jgi:hypothetical protein
VEQRLLRLENPAGSKVDCLLCNQKSRKAAMSAIGLETEDKNLRSGMQADGGIDMAGISFVSPTLFLDIVSFLKWRTSIAPTNASTVRRGRVQVWSATPRCWHYDVIQTDYRRCSRNSIDDTTGTLIIPRVKYSVLYFCRRLGHETRGMKCTAGSWSLGIGEAKLVVRPCSRQASPSWRLSALLSNIYGELMPKARPVEAKLGLRMQYRPAYAR